MSKRDEIQEGALTVALSHKRCGLAISMGVGKTLVGLKYISHLQEKNMNQLKVLVVAPKISIFDTWRSDAEKFNIDISSCDFITYLSLNKMNPHAYDVVVLDECHSLLNSHSVFLAMYSGKILGLTGTPPRYEESEKGVMVRSYCPIMYRYITDDAVSDNILNDYRIIVHYLPLSESNNYRVQAGSKQFWTSERKSYDFWSKRLMDADTKKQEQIASVMRMRAMMDFSTKEAYAKDLLLDIEDKCIVFCNTMEQADRLCKESYHSKNPNSEENLQLFKTGELKQLSCVLQLNEGVNIPNLRAGVILHAYGNERKSSQRIGRLLRLNPDDTATVHILCYKDTVDERWVRNALSDLDADKITHVYDTILYR